AAAKARRRGRAWQRGQRRLQKDIRRQAVTCYHDLRHWGYTLAEVAELLGVTPRTLRQWAYDSCPEKKAALPLGRPPARSDVAVRQEVLRFLKEEGPGVGVPTLQERFPDLARAELTDLVQRYRRVWSAHHHACMRRLRWPVPGCVWSMDFAEPSLLGAAWSLPPIDDCYPYLLAVRDLSSGYQLCWLPVTAATSALTCMVLTRLFAFYGVPLVLKANAGHPRRLQGQTPADAWASRSAITDSERVCFELTVNRQRSMARNELGLEQETQLNHWEDSAVDRKAIERALVEHDYLLFRGRRIPLIAKGGQVTNIG